MKAESKGKAAGEGTKRRVPTQARSLRRYEAIVAAAAVAFADHGFEATTMEGIAAGAETSIGSLYQFFPNKLALFREVATRAMALSRQTFAESMGPNPVARPWRELVDVVVDSYRAMHRDPLMRAVFNNMQLYGEYVDEEVAQLQEMTMAVAMLLGVWAPQLSPTQREVSATMVVNTVAAAMLLIAREEARADDLVAETKILVVRYLEPLVEGS
ncbi:MAG: TetR/AcrR family transcriptional regulator [Myxococcota bacterium]